MKTTAKVQAKRKIRRPIGTNTLRRAYKKTQITSPRMLKDIERRRKVIKLRQGGWSYEEIAEALDISLIMARSDVQHCLNMAATELLETSTEEVELQKSRLDSIVKTSLRYATECHLEERSDPQTGKVYVVEVPPNPAYASVVLKAEERRSKLLALDRPEIKKVEVSGIREYVGVDLDKI